MKKYRHKQTQDIVVQSCESGYYKNVNIPGGALIPGKYIENVTDWKEVAEKDYEILSILLKRSDKHEVRKVDVNDNESYIESLIKCDGISIHSLKRLSDGKIFTVGDKLTYGEIRQIQLGNSISTLWLDFKSFGGYCNICDMKKYKNPLFTTEDGVDIFEDSNGEFTYWSLKLDIWKVSNAAHICKNIIPFSSEELLKSNNQLRFSTKEKAEEYIIMNKPLLSIEDVKDHYCLGYIKDLKKLVKNKMS